MSLYDRMVLGVLRDMFWTALHAPDELILYRSVLEDLVALG